MFYIYTIIRFIQLFDNPINLDVNEDKKDDALEQTEHDKEFMQAYIETLKDRRKLHLILQKTRYYISNKT